MNDVVKTDKFTELYDRKKRKNNANLMVQINDGILALRHANDPARIGEPKNGRLKGTYGYRVNQSSRILYQVEWNKEGCTVRLLRVCNHKNVYKHG